MSALDPYEPLNSLKPFGADVWLVDGPEIQMSYGPAKLPFGTRMTVVRLAGGELWVHSPIAPEPALFETIDRLGKVSHLVAPNSLHYWYMADWIERYPNSRSYAVADLRRKAKRAFRIDHSLDAGARFAWSEEIDWALVPGTIVSEAVFHVRKAKVTILTDLIENFELAKVHKRWLRRLIALGRADGHTPLDLRITFWPERKRVAEAAAKVLGWPTERLALAHGKVFDAGGGAVLRRELGWAAGARA